jgi:dTDP-glucose 4,6-dehydratase
MLLVTGGAGFIGSNFVDHCLAASVEPVVTVDKLTYAGNLENLAAALHNPKHFFAKADISDMLVISYLLAKYEPRAIVNFAAESHVDRSIHDPDGFIQTNIVGAYRLLRAALAYWRGLPIDRRASFRFLQVSTDEVFGSLGKTDPPFCETTVYVPNNPYAASKAAADHMTRAFHSTYRFPVLTTYCSNNYGPRQFPEKLIPLVIHNALSNKAIPVYGDGGNVRDWLYVGDHCAAISAVLARGCPGETYAIGGKNERKNIDVVTLVCAILDAERPRADGRSYQEQVTFVADRPGHDRRYAIDASKIGRELGWRPTETLETGIAKTVQWYLNNQAWVANVTTGAYRDWVALQYGERPSSA